MLGLLDCLFNFLFYSLGDFLSFILNSFYWILYICYCIEFPRAFSFFHNILSLDIIISALPRHLRVNCLSAGGFYLRCLAGWHFPWKTSKYQYPEVVLFSFLKKNPHYPHRASKYLLFCYRSRLGEGYWAFI